MVLEQIILATVVVSLISLIGIILITPGKKSESNMAMVISFATGALLATAFFDLLPEAIGKLDPSSALNAALLGILAFFILEKFVFWHHHHHHSHKGEEKVVGYLNLIGDAFHNFFDGIAIAASFMAGAEFGIVTTFAIITHEIPQEIGDFYVLIYSGFSKSKALFFNLLSALAALLGGLFFYYFSGAIVGLASLGIAFTSGMFIYMAGTDLIPELFHNDEKKEHGIKRDLLQTGALFLGIMVIYLGIMVISE